MTLGPLSLQIQTGPAPGKVMRLLAGPHSGLLCAVLEMRGKGPQGTGGEGQGGEGREMQVGWRGVGDAAPIEVRGKGPRGAGGKGRGWVRVKREENRVRWGVL